MSLGSRRASRRDGGREIGIPTRRLCILYYFFHYQKHCQIISFRKVICLPGDFLSGELLQIIEWFYLVYNYNNRYRWSLAHIQAERVTWRCIPKMAAKETNIHEVKCTLTWIIFVSPHTLFLSWDSLLPQSSVGPEPRTTHTEAKTYLLLSFCSSSK